MKRILFLLVALALFSCDEVNFVKGILSPGFNSAKGADRALLVKNETQENLVAFHGTTDVKNVIGGVRAGQTAHYFSKSSSKNPNYQVFENSHDFPLVLVRHEDYKKHLTNLSGAPVFTTIYVAYNVDSDPTTYAYTISKALGSGQGGSLVINNQANINVELRLNGINGVPIAYAPNIHKNTKIYLEDGDYEIYPVFRQYSPKLKETITYYPSDKNGKARFATFSLSGNEVVLDIMEDWVDFQKMTYSVDYAYLTVINNYSEGIEVRSGNSILYTREKGIKFINSAEYYSFQMDITKSGETVSASRKFGQLKVVSGPYYCDLPEIEMEKGYVYSIYIIDNDEKLDYEKEGDTIKITKEAIDLGNIFEE